MQTLSDKLKSLGVNIGIAGLARPTVCRESYPIRSVLEGMDIHTPFGETFVIRQDYDSAYQHGRVTLSHAVNLELMALWGKVESLAQTEAHKIVFLDTETSGLAGGTGTVVFMAGMCFLGKNGFQVHQFFLESPDKEDAFLAGLDQFLTPFEVMVTFNGKTFDAPILNSRYIMNGLTSPLPGMAHIDLLHLARRLWRNRLPSRTLGELEREILSFERTQEDVPGWMVPQLYFDYVRTGDARPLAGVFYHNAIDILSLAALFNHCAELLSSPLGTVEVDGLDLVAIARLYEDLGKISVAADIYKKSLDQGLPRAFFLQTMLRFAQLHRRRGDWESAINCWQRAAEEKQFEACIELAKYFEHQQRDYDQAVEWTRRALKELDNSMLSPYQRKIVYKDINRRLERLRKRANHS